MLVSDFIYLSGSNIFIYIFVAAPISSSQKGVWSNYIRNFSDQTMVFISDGNSENGAHVGSTLWYSICLRHFRLGREQSKIVFFSETTYFPSCVRNMFWVTISYKYHGPDNLLHTFTSRQFSGKEKKTWEKKEEIREQGQTVYRSVRLLSNNETKTTRKYTNRQKNYTSKYTYRFTDRHKYSEKIIYIT